MAPKENVVENNIELNLKNDFDKNSGENIKKTNEENVVKANKRPAIIKFISVNKKYGARLVLKGIDFTIRKGQLLAVLAPEGSGKSSIAKMAAGLTRTTKGQVLVRGVKASRKTNFVISYQPDIPFFKYDVTVMEVVSLYERFFEDFKYKKAMKLLRHFKINTKLKIDNLSTTALYILQVILVSSRDASLFIFDDPLVHCDPKYRADIIKIIDGCRKDGAILLLSQIADGIDDITDLVVFLKRGSIYKNVYDADGFENEFGDVTLNIAYKEVFKNA